MSAVTEALLGAAFGLGGVAVLISIRILPRPRTEPAAAPPPFGVVPTAWRFCPHELRQRAATVHPDGSATCADCQTHIPGGDQ